MLVRRRWLALLPTGALGTACPVEEPCDEDVRAQVLDERVVLGIGELELEAELADEANERERGWQHRRCDREALLLVPDARGPLPIWGCNLVGAVDLAFLRDGAVVDVVSALAPCPEPCHACPQVGEGLDVDGVLETPAGAVEIETGDSVSGWP